MIDIVIGKTKRWAVDSGGPILVSDQSDKWQVDDTQPERVKFAKVYANLWNDQVTEEHMKRLFLNETILTHFHTFYLSNFYTIFPFPNLLIFYSMNVWCVFTLFFVGR